MKKKSVNWQHIFSLIKKEKLYNSIVDDCLFFNTSAIRDPFDTGFESDADYCDIINKVCGLTPSKPQEPSCLKDIPNQSEGIINKYVVDALASLLYESLRYEIWPTLYIRKTIKGIPKDTILSQKRHGRMLENLKHIIDKMTVINSTFNVVGVDDDSREIIEGALGIVYRTAQHYLRVIKVARQHTGPKTTTTTNTYLLYLYLYLHFCGGLPQTEAVASIYSLLVSQKMDLENHISDEGLKSRLFRAASRTIAIHKKAKRYKSLKRPL